MLEVRDVSTSFGGVKALDDVSFSMKENEVFGLLGPNGAGKTTLFNAIAGVYGVDKGGILFLGQDLGSLSPAMRCRLGIARTFQITQPFASLTVDENIMVAASRTTKGLTALRDIAGHYANLVGLEKKRSTPGNALSTGQRKRLELARALATQPRLLLMDEVTGGVDQASIGGMIELVGKLRSTGLTILLVEHNMTVMSRLADRVMFMDKGKKILEGAPSEVMADHRVLDLYLGDSHVEH